MSFQMDTEVTQSDIDTGIPDNCSKCPIALAVTREVPADLGVDRVEVDGDQVELQMYGGTALYRAELPSEAQRFVNGFDGRIEGVLIAPFHLSLKFEPVDYGDEY